MLHLSFSVSGSKYAVPVHYIEESIQRTHITRIPKMPSYLLGVMNLRGQIIPVYDTRLRMGEKPKTQERDELKALLQQREKEHVAWLNTLKKEIDNNQKITVQRDPSLCNFGKWYTPYLAELTQKQEEHGNVDNVFLSILKKFDAPHKEIHAMANKADALIKEGKTEELEKLMRHGDLVFMQLQELFQHFYAAIDAQEKRDIVVIINREDFQFGITVDEINTTIHIDELQELKDENELVEAIGLTGERPIQILNLENFSR